ncbi:prostatic acid phosphatase-like isoform X2 [Panulirus ornatus]|uniref:prostatic acid phosphatase-like isoform X2 n=1 Tax=Panulirus ornatus TaxID=150431 RepID=UPI003A855B9C
MLSYYLVVFIIYSVFLLRPGYGGEKGDTLELVQMRGKARQYALGKWLHDRYKDFINKKWIPEEVYVRSTDVDRTLMSALCNLAAFYYPDVPDRFEKDLAWLPTPIHTAPLSDDKLLSVDKSCPRIKKELDNQANLPEVKNVTNASQELFQYLTKMSGDNITSIETVDYLYDTLHIESLNNLTLPNWTHEVLPRMKELADFSFKIVAMSKELKRLRAGPIIKEMSDHMRQKVAGNLPKQKMYMYSAHDITLSVLLLGLGVFNNVAPPYATTVLIELHKMDGEHFVQMFLRNDTQMVEPPHKLILPGCTFSCPLEKWLNLTSEVVPEDWDEECNSHSNELPFNMAMGTLAALTIAVILAIILIALIFYNFCGWRQHTRQFMYQAVPNNIT